MTGERGPTGDHGQMGDTGATGAKGATGAQGASAVTPWVVRQANVAYAMLALGLFMFVLVSQWQERQAAERDAKTMVRFEAQTVATDRSFCALANQSRAEINRNRDAIRTLEAAVRQSFEAVQPAPDATPIQRQRTNEFRVKILGLLDSVKIDGNLALLDCSGIGEKLDFSLQDTVTNATTTTRP